MQLAIFSLFFFAIGKKILSIHLLSDNHLAIVFRLELELTLCLDVYKRTFQSHILLPV